MDWLLNMLGEFWQALTTPQEVDIAMRLKWSIVTGALFVFGGLWVGQLALTRSRAYFPKERFSLALCWAFLAYALFLAALLGAGWWRGGTFSWGAMVVHLPAMLAALVAALVFTPAAPPRADATSK